MTQVAALLGFFFDAEAVLSLKIPENFYWTNDITSLKLVLFIVTSMTTSNPTYYFGSLESTLMEWIASSKAFTVENFTPFMESKHLVLCSQDTTTGTRHESVESIFNFIPHYF
jgi:hypothetical protein